MADNETIAEHDSESLTVDIGGGIYRGSAEKVALLKPVLMALTHVRLFNLPVPWTLSAAIRNWESYIRDKPRFLGVFTREGFDSAALDDFPDRIGVLWYLDAALAQVVDSATLSSTFSAEARQLHEKFARAALYLYENHPTLGNVVTDIRQGMGYLDMADDLARYALLFDQQWEETKGKCAITREDIENGGRLSLQMLTALTDNKHPETLALKELRSRAGEYLLQGAHQIRRAARYVFDDAPKSMKRYPSLYRKLSKSRNRYMNGETVPVEMEKVRLEEILNVTDIYEKHPIVTY